MDLKQGSHIHLMGICGTAMASLAGLLKDRGFKVSGSDANPYPPMSTQIESLGIEIKKGYSAANLHPKPDFVVVGNVISRGNAEAEELEKLSIPFTSLPKAMGEYIIANHECINISGTHGKTTTTSLMSWLLDQLGEKPGFLIGGIPKNFSYSFRNPVKKYFVIEGDEYDTAYFDKVPKFTHYRPKHTILTSVEFDHADIYKDLDDVKKAFAQLIKLTPEDGTLIYCADEKNVADLVKSSKTKNRFGYGLKSDDYLVKNFQASPEFSNFDLSFIGVELGNFKVPMSGIYNVMNTVACIAMLHQLQFPLAEIKKHLLTFQGVKRRQEILGEPNGKLVIEDFAHHPTAVKETILGIKQKYPQRRVFAVFEPRSATSRRKVFQNDYVEAFLNADQVILMKPFDQSKIGESDRFSTTELIEDLDKRDKKAVEFEQVDQIVEFLKTHTQKGDLILIMSNGGFDGIYTKLLKSLA